MKHQTPNVLLSVTLLAATSSMAWGQQCWTGRPNSTRLTTLLRCNNCQWARSEGWPNLNPQMNGGISLQQGIQSLDQAIQQFQQQLQQAQQAWLATRSGNAPMPKMNGAESEIQTTWALRWPPHAKWTICTMPSFRHRARSTLLVAGPECRQLLTHRSTRWDREPLIQVVGLEVMQRRLNPERLPSRG